MLLVADMLPLLLSFGDDSRLNPHPFRLHPPQGDAFKTVPSAAGGSGGFPSGRGPETAFGKVTAALLSDRALEVADARDKILVKYTV